MPLVPPTREELFTSFKRSMEALGFTHWAEGSRIGALVRVVTAYLQDIWEGLAHIEQQTNLSTARGIYLDRRGADFGVTRLPSQAATTLGKGPAIQFTNNGLTSGTIPGGTRVWSAEDPDVAFFTLNSLTLAAGAQGFVDVIAARPGDLYNVGTGVLTTHNAGTAQYSVTNVRPIGGGSTSESDASYRFRITQSLQARHGSTALAIQQALLRVPGVRDALVQSGVRGSGSVDVIVIPIDRYASQALLTACEQALGDVIAAGISWRLRTPIVRQVGVQVQLRLAAGAQLAAVRALVESRVRGYIDNLRVNDGQGNSDLIYHELVSRVQEASPDVIDSSLTLTLDNIPVLATNITAAPGERLVSGNVRVS